MIQHPHHPPSISAARTENVRKSVHTTETDGQETR